SSQHHVDLLFYSTEPPTPVIYPLSLHDALPIFAGAVVAKVCAEWQVGIQRQWARVGLAAGGRFHHLFDTIIRGELYCRRVGGVADRKSTRLNSSHVKISYAVFCLKKKIKNSKTN